MLAVAARGYESSSGSARGFSDEATVEIGPFCQRHTDTDTDDEMDTAYRNFRGSASNARDGFPDLTLVAGDAVYADAPWWIYGTIENALYFRDRRAA